MRCASCSLPPRCLLPPAPRSPRSSTAPARAGTPLDENAPPPPMPREVNNDDPPGARNWPRAAAGDPAQDRQLPDRPQRQQMPDLPRPRVHRRSRRRRWSASPTSWIVTARLLAAVSPRRYFCTQCHVPQTRGASRWSTTASRTSTRSSSASAPGSAVGDREHVGRLLTLASATWHTLTRPSVHFSLGFLTARRLHHRRRLLGRLQHRARADQHRDLLHLLPRDARQRLPGAEADHPLHQPLGRARDLPDCHVPHEWTAQDRPQDAGVQGGLGQDLRHDQHAREVPRPTARAGRARMGAAQGQRLARMPQLPHGRVDGHHPPERRAPPTRTTRFLFTGERTCIDCHKGIAHHLPDMAGVPGWDVPVRN